ncbi:uncharacterized protein LOC134801364 [Cydia splendana]|uniref:uncharacterized protein LOC134801364 n=1 Tax=Cydia splendana TaxID=1100963 RepID=UPI00300C6A96
MYSRFIVINDPDDAFTVLNSCLKKSYFYNVVFGWFGDGLLTSDVSKWKRNRKLLNPTFSQHVLDGFLDVFNRQAALLAQDMEPKAGTGEFDPTELFLEATLEAVCQTAVGISLDDQSVIDSEYKKAIAVAFEGSAQRLGKFWLHPDFLYQFSGLRKRIEEAVAVIRNMSKTVFNKRRAERQQTKLATTSSRRFLAFLDLLLELGDEGSFADEQILRELDVFIAAGLETSARALVSIMVFLGTYTDVQDKLYQERADLAGAGRVHRGGPGDLGAGARLHHGVPWDIYGRARQTIPGVSSDNTTCPTMAAGRFLAFLDLLLELGDEGSFADEQILRELDVFIAAGLETSARALVSIMVSDNTTCPTMAAGRFLAFLDLLLELGDEGSFADEQILRELDVFIAAGLETSARALVSIMVFLGTYTDVQDKLYQEIISVLGPSSYLGKEDMSRLVYTEAIIKEALRLSPVIPVIGREVDKDIKLKNYTLPAGSGCAVLFWGIHRLPIWGADRLQFRPERWLDPSRVPSSPGAFCGFSLGRRNCIGKPYAYMVVKTMLVHLVRKYRVSADYSKVKLKFDLVLKYVEGQHISLQLREWFWENGKEVSEAAEKAGGVITLWAGPRVIFAINDPDDAFTVLNSCLEKSYYYRLGSSWVGYGLLTSNVPTWKRHRKLMNPTFSQHVLDGFLDVFNRQAAILAQDMEPKAGKGEFIPMEYITERTLEAVCQTVIGISLDDRSVINKEYKSAIEDGLYVIAERLASFWLQPEICYRFSGLRKIMDKAMVRVHNMSRTVKQPVKSLIATFNQMAERRMLNKRRSERLEARHASTTPSRFIAFLDLLLDLTEDGSFTDEQIQEELDTLIAAGYDTSSRALLSTLVLVGTYQEVQEKMYQEIMSVLGSSVDLVKEDMPRLVYTEAVIKEVLRLSPVAPFVAREVEKEVKLKNYTIPAGSECAVTFWGIHRLPIWGPDRLEFRPERWLDPFTLPQSPSAFCGFSLGRRNCIGKTYALMSMKTALVHLIRKYRITADHSKVKLKYAVLLEYAAGHEISLELRE